jgi:hypothetical protein
VAEPDEAARRWSDVLGVPLADVGVRTVAGSAGINEIRLSRPFDWAPFDVGTVRFSPSAD